MNATTKNHPCLPSLSFHYEIWAGCLLLIIVGMCSADVQAQTQIESVVTITESNGAESYTVNGKTVNFSGNNLLLLTFEIGGDVYQQTATFTSVHTRRNDSGPASQGYPFGNKATVWYQGTCSTSNCATASIVSSSFNTEEGSITNRYLNQGSDNTFDNNRPGADANNNIERIDLVFSAGIPVGNADLLNFSGFPIFERSGGNSFGIAAITSLDGSGNPNGFDADGDGNDDDIIQVSNNNGDALTTGFAFVNFRGTNDTDLEPYESGTNQSVKGVFVSLADLGLSVGQTIYGYALFGPDVTTSYDLTDYTSFPTSTEGGADLIAAGNYFTLTGVLPVELTSFDARLDGRTALLHWASASETNNAGFEVQMRQANHTDWNALSWVDGHGTTEVEQNYSFQITDLQPGRHTFRLKQIDYDGTFEYSPEVEVVVEMAERFVMEAAYPNPFNPEATFRFAVSRAQTVEVGMYNLLGRRVALLWRGEAEAGRMQAVRLDGSGLPSGVYLVRAIGEGFVETQRVSLIK